jgi:hypothetical protein
MTACWSTFGRVREGQTPQQCSRHIELNDTLEDVFDDLMTNSSFVKCSMASRAGTLCHLEWLIRMSHLFLLFYDVCLLKFSLIGFFQDVSAHNAGSPGSPIFPMVEFTQDAQRNFVFPRIQHVKHSDVLEG